MKLKNLYLVLKYDCVSDKYIEVSLSNDIKIAYECFNLLRKKYPYEMYLITKVLEV